MTGLPCQQESAGDVRRLGPDLRRWPEGERGPRAGDGGARVRHRQPRQATAVVPAVDGAHHRRELRTGLAVVNRAATSLLQDLMLPAPTAADLSPLFCP